MTQPNNEIDIRDALEADRSFIFSLSPILAGVANLDWHLDSTVLKFQDGYIAEMLEPTDVQKITLIAEKNGAALGFIHARTHKDAISGEECCTVPLLAVAQEAQGTGAGKFLMAAAEAWAKQQGYRLLHLEVFSANDKAQGFYQSLGFRPDSLNMIKPLD